MTKTEVYQNLCYYDKRNPDNYGEDVEPRKDCYCDSCFRGTDKLALEILRLRDK